MILPQRLYLLVWDSIYPSYRKDYFIHFCPLRNTTTTRTMIHAASTLSNSLLSRRVLPKLLHKCASSSTATRSIASSVTAKSVGVALTTPTFHSQSKPHSAPFPTFQKRSLFIQTAETPNPESLKFIPNGRLVLGHKSDKDSDRDAVDQEEEVDTTDNHDNQGVYLTRKDHTLIARSPLAKILFNLDEGVKSVYLGYDFITVTKYAEAHWQHLQTPIFGAIMDFYASGKPALLEVPEITDTTILEDDDEVVAMIKELLESRIRPAVQEDGGDIRYVGFEEDTGIVTVRLAGSCVGCPSSSVTLKNGVENMLMHYIPEVTSVISLDDDEDDRSEGGGEVVVEQNHGDKKMKTYEERLAAAGIPFSD
ncbi:hypothetical protein ACHAXS_011366 [Conticribra weissflogii]